LLNSVEKIIENTTHKNKGIRIVCYELLNVYNKILDLKCYEKKLMEKLNTGLVDFWQQVRFPCLNLLSGYYYSNLLNDTFFIENILPKICLNRYIPVDGVKTLALKLWKDIVDINGVNIIKSNYDKFLNTYIIEL